MRVSLIALTVLVGIMMIWSLGEVAQTLQDVPPVTKTAPRPVVAELFTSQSCSSCPPTEKLFAELDERDDLIVLEWHVDYWDKLVHGHAGAWKDPYSSTDYIARQRQYNRAFHGTGGAYTPQAVINGSAETVGNRRSDVPRRENRGIRLFSRNVVLDATQIGDYSGNALTRSADAPEANEGSAIIIQEKRGNRLGPILGASYCN